MENGESASIFSKKGHILNDHGGLVWWVVTQQHWTIYYAGHSLQLECTRQFVLSILRIQSIHWHPWFQKMTDNLGVEWCYPKETVREKALHLCLLFLQEWCLKQKAPAHTVFEASNIYILANSPSFFGKSTTQTLLHKTSFWQICKNFVPQNILMCTIIMDVYVVFVSL